MENERQKVAKIKNYRRMQMKFKITDATKMNLDAIKDILKHKRASLLGDTGTLTRSNLMIACRQSGVKIGYEQTNKLLANLRCGSTGSQKSEPRTPFHSKRMSGNKHNTHRKVESVYITNIDSSRTSKNSSLKRTRNLDLVNANKNSYRTNLGKFSTYGLE